MSKRRKTGRGKPEREKPTTIQIVAVIIEAITAIAALIAAVRWW